MFVLRFSAFCAREIFLLKKTKMNKQTWNCLHNFILLYHLHPDVLRHHLSGTGTQKSFYDIFSSMLFLEAKLDNLPIFEKQKSFQEIQRRFPKDIKYQMYFDSQPRLVGLWVLLDHRDTNCKKAVCTENLRMRHWFCFYYSFSLFQ